MTENQERVPESVPVPERVSGAFEVACAGLRVDIQGDAVRLLELKANKRFTEDEDYVGQHGEMRANIMLAFRHLEDARMRVGKILQAAGDGVSILDK